MAQFKVLRSIELGGKLYLPETIPPSAPLLAKEGNKGWLAKSASNGADIPVDASGVIELTEAQAAEMTMGQVQVLPQAKPAIKAKIKN